MFSLFCWIYISSQILPCYKLRSLLFSLFSSDLFKCIESSIYWEEVHLCKLYCCCFFFNLKLSDAVIVVYKLLDWFVQETPTPTKHTSVSQGLSDSRWSKLTVEKHQVNVSHDWVILWHKWCHYKINTVKQNFLYQSIANAWNFGIFAGKLRVPLQMHQGGYGIPRW